MRQTIPQDHIRQREEIERQTAEFLSRGGQIETVSSAAPAVHRGHNERCDEFRLQMQEQIRSTESKPQRKFTFSRKAS